MCQDYQQGRRNDGRASFVGFRLVAVVLMIGICGCAHAPLRFDPRARRTCLVLSAGGTRGVAELGALAALREANFSISCVVGTSVGALMGGLYASAPDQDTTARFRSVAQAYKAASEDEATRRGLEAGAVAGAIAATVSGGVLLPVGAALGGFLWGADTVARASLERMSRVLDAAIPNADIGGLPIPYATFHQERTPQGLRLMTDTTGPLAKAIARSIANPFIFEDMDLNRAVAIDPGSDRLAVVPVDDACRLFSDANLLVVNISGERILTTADMHCPVQEIAVQVPPLSGEDFFSGGPAFERAWAAGYQATADSLQRSAEMVR